MAAAVLGLNTSPSAPSPFLVGSSLPAWPGDGFCFVFVFFTTGATCFCDVWFYILGDIIAISHQSNVSHFLLDMPYKCDENSKNNH